MSNNTHPDREFLTTAEVLSMLQIGRSTLWTWRKEQGFPQPFQGRYYNRAKVKAWVEAR